MSAARFACPSCRTLLQLSAAPPIDQWINCPQCRTHFRLSAAKNRPEGITATLSPSLPHGDEKANGWRQPADTVPIGQPAPAVRRSGAVFWLALGSALGCGVLLFGGATGVAAWLLWPDPRKPAPSPPLAAGRMPVPPPFPHAPRGKPSTAVEWFAEGNRRRQRGDLDEAIDAYTQAIELNPRYAAAYCNRGLTRSDKNDFDGAIADATKAIELNPNDPFPFINRANARILKGVDPKASIADATQALKLRPGIPAALINRGMAYHQSGDFDNAIADFTRAVELLPTFAQTYYQRGQTWMKKERWDKAEADFSRVIQLGVGRSAVYQNRAVTRLKQGNHRGAIDDFTVLLRRQPRNTALLVSRGAAHFAAGDDESTQADLDRALAIDPSFLPAHHYRIRFARRRGDREGTLAACERLVEVWPKSADALACRAGVRAWRGEDDKAQADYAAALALNPKHVSTYLLRGWLHLSAGRDDNAAGDAETGLKIAGWEHRQAPYLAILACCGQQRLHPNQARRFAAEALPKVAKKWPHTILEYLHGDMSDKEFLHVAANNDQRTEAHTYVGIVRWLSGAGDKAREHFQWVYDRGNRNFVEYNLAELMLHHLDAP